MVGWLESILSVIQDNNLVSEKTYAIIEEICKAGEISQENLLKLEKMVEEEEKILKKFIESLKKASLEKDRIKQSLDKAKEILALHPWIYSIIFFLLNAEDISLKFAEKAVTNFEVLKKLPEELKQIFPIVYRRLVVKSEKLFLKFNDLAEKDPAIKMFLQASLLLSKLPEGKWEGKILVYKKEYLEKFGLLDTNFLEKFGLLGANLFENLNHILYPYKIWLEIDHKEESLSKLKLEFIHSSIDSILERVCELLGNVGFQCYLKDIIYMNKIATWLIIEPIPDKWGLFCFLFALELKPSGQYYIPCLRILLNPFSKDPNKEYYLLRFMERYGSFYVDKEFDLNNMMNSIIKEIVKFFKNNYNQETDFIVSSRSKALSDISHEDIYVNSIRSIDIEDAE